MIAFDENSEEMKRINREWWEKYMQLATADYIRKISGIATFSSDKDAFHIDNSFHGKPAPNHIIYKLGSPLMSADGKRGYEFVVEYDRYEPNVGIYFGAKGLIFDTENTEKQIAIINAEWEQVRPAIMLALNDMYPECHFNLTQRYKQTDNANNYTYWPFWIELHEHEPIEVACHAVIAIRRLYERLVAGNCPDCRLSDRTPQRLIQAAFTDDAYQRFVCAMYAGNVSHATTVNTFVERMLSEQIIERETIFEHAYRLKDIDMTGFAFLMVAFYVSLSNGKTRGRLPWQGIVDVFLNEDLRRMDNLKRLYGAPVGAARDKAERRAAALLKSLIP